MCSEFRAMQSFTKYNSAMQTIYGDLAGANDWTVYFELPELKAFSIKHFPQDICQTKKQVDAFVITQTGFFFCWPGNYGSN